MTRESQPVATPAAGKGNWRAVLVLVVAGWAAYANTFSAPFVFDDDEAIVNNPAIKRLWPLSAVMLGGQEGGMSGQGRPVVNLTLALNHAISGERVWSYHAFNLGVHLAAGLVLFGLVRRTLGSPVLAARFGRSGEGVALLAALLWLVHPLQTGAVTYIIQRAESLTGLCYVLTLYTFVRATGSPRPRGWLGWSVASCLAGMGCKEVMVSAPLMVLLYDRTFVAGSFRAAWRARWSYYVMLVATWVLLGWLVAGSGGRGDSAGFDTTVTSWHYLLTQSAAVMHYLRLVVWPHPLVLDYGTEVVGNLAAVWWQAPVLTALAGLTLWALWRRPLWGFFGAWFFALLAPSSSFVPVATQTMAEHRMYLALAAPLVLFALGLHALAGRRGLWIGIGLATLGIVVTHQRNQDYASRQELWAGAVAERPANARAHNNLAIELAVAGRPDEAIAHFQEALRLEPKRTDARTNLANEWLKQGRLPEAIADYEKVLQAKPDDVLALGNLGVALMQAGRLGEAKARYEQLVAIDPTDASAHSNLGYLSLQAGDARAALGHYQRAADLSPADARAQFNLAVALARNGQVEQARAKCDEALRLDPTSEGARQLREQLLAGRRTSR